MCINSSCTDGEAGKSRKGAVRTDYNCAGLMLLQHSPCQQPLPKAPEAQESVKHRQSSPGPVPFRAHAKPFQGRQVVSSSLPSTHTHTHAGLAALASIYTVASSLDFIQFLERTSGRANFQRCVLPAQGHRALPVGEGTG